MNIKRGSMYPAKAGPNAITRDGAMIDYKTFWNVARLRQPSRWYWVPRAGMLFGRPWFVWLDRFWWVFKDGDA